jgi:hypothetical protein
MAKFKELIENSVYGNFILYMGSPTLPYMKGQTSNIRKSSKIG